jgi:hypothetical protein
VPWSLDWIKQAANAVLKTNPPPPGPEGGAQIVRRMVDRLSAAERLAAEAPPPANATAKTETSLARVDQAKTEPSLPRTEPGDAGLPKTEPSIARVEPKDELAEALTPIDEPLPGAPAAPVATPAAPAPSVPPPPPTASAAATNGPPAWAAPTGLTPAIGTPPSPPGAAATPGPASTFEALIARIALAGAQAAADKLLAASAPVLVDAEAIASLTKLADAAGERLQQEANGAIAKGQTDLLGQIRSLRQGLSQDLLAFKACVDRLRGLEVAPSLGAGDLDPDVQIAAAAKAAPRKATQPQQEAAKKIEFVSFEPTPQSSRRSRWLLISLGVLALSAANAFYFAQPHPTGAKLTALEQAGRGVVSITTAKNRAIVAVQPNWLDQGDGVRQKLAQVLLEMKIEQAILTLPDGRPVGTLMPKTGRLNLVIPGKAAQPAAPPPQQPAPAQPAKTDEPAPAPKPQ